MPEDNERPALPTSKTSAQQQDGSLKSPLAARTELWVCVGHLGFVHMDGKEAKCPFVALRLQRAWSTLGASSDVSKRAVPVIATAVVQLLACRTEIAVAFRLVREALRAERRAPCPSHSIARGHVRRDLSIHQPLQKFTIAIAGIGSDGLRGLTLPLSEPSYHLLGSSGFLA